VKQSEITLIEALSMLDGFAPIKISLNGIVLYNDYDSTIQIGDSEMYGETAQWQDVVMKRLWQSKDYIITDISVKIVQHHHSIISLRGHYEPYEKDE
jgi:hypothetical protein